MQKKICLAVIAASVFIAPFAMAEGAKNELSISGNIDNSTQKTDPGNTSTSTSSTSVLVGLGQYLTPKLVLKENVFLMTAGSGATKTDMTMLGVGVKYYFGLPAKSAWVPFVGGGVNLVSTKSGNVTFTGAGFAAGGGVSYFITEDVSGDFELQGYYNSTSATVANISVTAKTTGTKFMFGTTVRF